MILLPHFDIPYGFGLGKIPYDLPFQGPVFFGLPYLYVVSAQLVHLLSRGLQEIVCLVLQGCNIHRNNSKGINIGYKLAL